MKPILVEIVTRMITTFGHCRHCDLFFEEAGLKGKLDETEKAEYPPDLIEESKRLGEWIQELKQLYKHRLSIRLIEAKSFLGFYKSLRHRIRRYPGFIIEKRETYAGWDKRKLEDLLDKHIKASILRRNRDLQPTLP